METWYVISNFGVFAIDSVVNGEVEARKAAEIAATRHPGITYIIAKSVACVVDAPPPEQKSTLQWG